MASYKLALSYYIYRMSLIIAPIVKKIESAMRIIYVFWNKHL